MLSSKFLRWGAAGVRFWQKCAWGHAKTHEDAIVAVDASDTGAVELRDFSADFACAFGDSCNPPSLIASCSGASTACAGKLWATAKFQLRRNVTKQSESIYYVQCTLNTSTCDLFWSEPHLEAAEHAQALHQQNHRWQSSWLKCWILPPHFKGA